MPERDEGGRIFFLTSHDADAAMLASARETLPPGFPVVDLVTAVTVADANLQDAVLDRAAAASVAMVRLMGGPESIGGLFPRLVAIWTERGIPVIAQRSYPMPNDDMARFTTVSPEAARPALDMLLAGGVENFGQMLRYLSDRFAGTDFGWAPASPLPWEGVYHPMFAGEPTVDELIARHWAPGWPAVGILFYRSQLQAGDTVAVDALIAELEALQINVLPIYTYGLRASANSRDGAEAVCELLSTPDGAPLVDCIVSMLSFSGALLDSDGSAIERDQPAGLGRLGIPTLQAMQSLFPQTDWHDNPAGLSPVDISVSVAMPEINGRIITVPAAFKVRPEVDRETLASRARPHSIVPDRIVSLARQARRWARLRRLPNAEKKVAILLNNPNGRDARIGAASGLDAAASTVRLLRELAGVGYRVEDIPADGDELVHRIIERCSNSIDDVTPAQLAGAVGHVDAAAYARQFAALADAPRQAMEQQWGPAPGDAFRIGDRIAVPGIVLGNIFVGPQPQRGFGLDPDAIAHSPDLPPAHQYLAVYQWLRDDFGADAIINMGKHGNLEWLPGKGVALSSACFPDIAQAEVPLIYPYIINNPGEGTQAKRRAHAVIVNHLTPPVSTAESYGAAAELERLTAEYAEAAGMDERRQPPLREQIWAQVVEANLTSDLGYAEPPEDGGFGAFLHDLAHYLSELRDAQINTGLHILGAAPAGEPLVETLSAMLRLPSGGAPSLHAALADALGLDWEELLRDRGAPVAWLIPAPLVEVAQAPIHTNADLVDRIEMLARRALQSLVTGADPMAVWLREPAVAAALQFAGERLLPALARTSDEMTHVLAALEGRFVPPGLSGAPTRGQTEVLPTGRNFYSMDPRALPSRAAWEVGKGLTTSLIQKHLDDEGAYPESVAVIIWGTANMRTRGEDIAQVLYLLGVEPCWDPASGRVTGVRAISLEQLGRPRIDAIARISGFFRDSFPNSVHLIDDAVRTVAELDEPHDRNFVRKHVDADRAAGREGAAALYRVFAPQPGAYVDGVAQLIDHRNWETRRDIAEVYANWVSHAYTKDKYGAPAREQFIRRAGELDVVVKNRDNQEHDVFDTDDYFQDHGAMAAVAQELGGASGKAWIGDSTRPSAPAVRDASDEARRTFRRRAMNPRWIEGMKRHGYKGALELLKTVDYAFGYDATTGVIEDWMYEGFAQRYLFDAAMQEFFREHNPWALRDLTERLLEAQDRGLWEHPSPETRHRLRALLLDAESVIEGRGEPAMKGSAE